jgi:hypothetical protein
VEPCSTPICPNPPMTQDRAVVTSNGPSASGVLGYATSDLFWRSARADCTGSFTGPPAAGVGSALCVHGEALTVASNSLDFLLERIEGLGLSDSGTPTSPFVDAGCNTDQGRAVCVQRAARVTGKLHNVRGEQVRIRVPRGIGHVGDRAVRALLRCPKSRTESPTFAVPTPVKNVWSPACSGR